MMRESIRTIGISAILDNPILDLPQENQTPDPVDTSPPGLLRREEAASNQTAIVRGSRRGASYNFDLGVESIGALSEDGLGVL